MTWNWEQPRWPQFTYDKAALEPLEKRFLLHSGEVVGTFKHVGTDDRDMLRIELISDEALKTSAIEGEVLDYISITRTSRATATRDLQHLVARGALTRTGERRHARYHLNIPMD